MSKHTPGLAADGWTLIYRDAKQASYAKGAIQNGADAECVGPGDEGWYWYHEGTGQLGDRNAVAPIGRPLGNLVEQHQFALPFARSHVVER